MDRDEVTLIVLRTICSRSTELRTVRGREAEGRPRPGPGRQAEARPRPCLDSSRPCLDSSRPCLDSSDSTRLTRLRLVSSDSSRQTRLDSDSSRLRLV